MPAKRTYLAAWTSEGSNMPKYVNLTHVADEDPAVEGVEITVRSPADLGSTTSVCRVPLRDFGTLVDELNEKFKAVRK